MILCLLLFFFLAILLPPRSTLFPYTTLFRSGSDGGRAGAAALHRRAAGGGRGEGWPRAPIRDRKSTRLNSSHTVISYAVFCLKKKKKKYNHNQPSTLALRNSSR